MEDPPVTAGRTPSRRSPAKDTSAAEPRGRARKTTPAAVTTRRATATGKTPADGRAAAGTAAAGTKRPAATSDPKKTSDAKTAAEIKKADNRAKDRAPRPGTAGRGTAQAKSPARPAAGGLSSAEVGPPKPGPSPKTAPEPAPRKSATQVTRKAAETTTAPTIEEGAVEEALATVPETSDTAHIDGALIEVARAGAVRVEVGPAAIAQLELGLTDLERSRYASTSHAPVTAQHIPLWARVVADPGYAAEHAASEAVHRLGPEALDWVIRASARYPEAGPDALARLAAKESVRTARRQGAASGAAGVAGSVAATAVLAHVQARLVLTIAAAYGFDPTERERARDLLNVLRVPRLTQPTTAAIRNAGRVVAGFAVRRVAARLMPFGAAVAGGAIGARSTRDVADRAMAHYRRQNPPRW